MSDNKKLVKVRVKADSFWNLRQLKKGQETEVYIADGVETPQFERLDKFVAPEAIEKDTSAQNVPVLEAETPQPAEEIVVAEEVAAPEVVPTLEVAIETTTMDVSEPQAEIPSYVDLEAMSQNALRSIAAQKGYRGENGFAKPALLEFLKNEAAALPTTEEVVAEEPAEEIATPEVPAAEIVAEITPEVVESEAETPQPAEEIVVAEEVAGE